MRIAAIVSGLLVVLPSVASAEIARSDLKAPRTADHFELIASQPTDTHITFVRQLLPANGAIAAVAKSRIIYLNRKGIIVTPGNNDSRTNRSSIVNQQRSIPAWNVSEATWTATVSCMKDMFSRWDVVVTDQDPGSMPHIEAVFGGSPQNLGMPSGVGGVSPFTSDCGIIENSIVFTFTSVIGNNPQTVCEVMAQEVAHSYGLDHELLASDPMTYLSYNGKRSFKDQTVSCGEYQARSCGIGGQVCRPNQNSVQLLNARLGLADAIAPVVGITSPHDGATVEPGFEVQAMATDNIAVTSATLLVDDVAVGSVSGAGPFAWPTDVALAEGSHSIAVEVTDGRNTQRETIQVTVMKAVPPGDGDGIGSGTGSGGGEDVDGDGDVDQDDARLSGGCASTRDIGLALGLLVFAQFVVRRRRL